MKRKRCIVIGAGVSGLVAARRLKDAGLDVLMLDKGRYPGGRMSTKHIHVDEIATAVEASPMEQLHFPTECAKFDIGVQYIKAITPLFQTVVQEWKRAGILSSWKAPFKIVNGNMRLAEGSQRFLVPGGMRNLPLHLASDLEILNDVQIISAGVHDKKWFVKSITGEMYSGDCLLVATPVPQALTILEMGGTVFESDVYEALHDVEYHSSYALMLVVPEEESLLQDSVGIRFLDGPVSWIADNVRKGVSKDWHTLTVHASHDYSNAMSDDDPDAVREDLVRWVATNLGLSPMMSRVHRWKYSRVAVGYSDASVVTEADGACLAFAGDAFGSYDCNCGGVERAVLSGMNAAERMLEKHGG